MSAPTGDHCPRGGPPPDGEPCGFSDCEWCVSRGYAAAGPPLDPDGTREAWSRAFKAAMDAGSLSWDAVAIADASVPAVPIERQRATDAILASIRGGAADS